MHETAPDAGGVSGGEIHAAPRLPGEPGVWVLVSGDMVVFAVLFLTYSYYRATEPALFHAGQLALNQRYALINTYLLLTSSWFVSIAVRGARRALPRLSALMFALAFCCGAAFVCLKVLEYREKLSHGVSMLTNDFFMFYFVMTGIHCVHVILGLGVLGFLSLRARAGLRAGSDVRLFETGATFWHMVDLLWLVLYALLYLSR